MQMQETPKRRLYFIWFTAIAVDIFSSCTKFIWFTRRRVLQFNGYFLKVTLFDVVESKGWHIIGTNEVFNGIYFFLKLC